MSSEQKKQAAITALKKRIDRSEVRERPATKAFALAQKEPPPFKNVADDNFENLEIPTIISARGPFSLRSDAITKSDRLLIRSSSFDSVFEAPAWGEEISEEWRDSA